MTTKQEGRIELIDIEGQITRRLILQVTMSGCNPETRAATKPLWTFVDKDRGLYAHSWY